MARDRLEVGGGEVGITRFLMTNDDVSRGRFVVDRRGIERGFVVSWTICSLFFFFFEMEEEGEELSDRLTCTV